MTLPPTPSDMGHQQIEIQLTLELAAARRLRVVLPWLVRALEDRGTRTPKQRERRREAHAAVESLLGTLSDALLSFEMPDEAGTDG